MNEFFIERAKRDAKAKELKEQGFIVRRFSTRNQLLHPKYVEDYPRKLTADECGFGNTLYKTYFAVLYGVESSRGKSNREEQWSWRKQRQ